MKRFLLPILLLLTAPLFAQQRAGGGITATASTCMTGVCVQLNPLPPGTASVSFNVSGTYSGTLQFEVSADGVHYAAVNSFPPNSTTAATSTTSTGTWTAAVAGMTVFRVRASGYASGQADVSITASTAIAGAFLSPGGGGGSGTVQSQASGVIPLATGSSTIGAQSACDDGNTTAATITCSEPITSAAAIKGTHYLTATNCAANGTAANPSVVACSAATAGMFSCDPMASTGTCQVNTTAVTSNSEILITQDAADGGASQLNVTCNTALVTPAAKPILLSKANGASFTINLGTVTSNPGCFEYLILN